MSKGFYGREDEVVPGTLVYEAFYPQNPGVVRRVVSNGPWVDAFGNDHPTQLVVKVEVEWLKETKKRDKITQVNVMPCLQDFEALIEEHERKAKNQRKLALALESM